MPNTSPVRIPLSWTNVDVFTFGKSTLYGYDSTNHCLSVRYFTQLSNITDSTPVQLHLSASPAWPIRKLVLNEDETVLALLSEKVAYLVCLPKFNIQDKTKSPSTESNLCFIIRVPPLTSSSSSPTINCFLIDFVWLTPSHFVVAYTIPSSSECHLFKISSFKQLGLEHIQTFTVGESSTNAFGTPQKKISLRQPSAIIKFDVTKRKQKNLQFILLFSMKSDGDIFVLEIDQNQLLSDEKTVFRQFDGPLCILPPRSDNYGTNCGQSTFMCLSNSSQPLFLFTHNRFQVNQCIILSPSLGKHYLFTIDSICLPKNENPSEITSMIRDPILPNRYLISDSAANVYLIEISWVSSIQNGLKQLPSTQIRHLIYGANTLSKIVNTIDQISFIQTNDNVQYLAIIVNSLVDKKKELIFIHTQSVSPDESYPVSENAAFSSEFLNKIRSLLMYNQSIPRLTLSTSSMSMSNADFASNLTKFSQIFIKQYIERQNQVRIELENKQKYLVELQRTHNNTNQKLNERYKQAQQRYSLLREHFQRECSRQRRLAEHVSDIQSIIEHRTPVISDSEKRMQQQLDKYETQINYLKNALLYIKQFIQFNQDEAMFDTSFMKVIQDSVQDQRNHIDRIRKQMNTILNKI